MYLQGVDRADGRLSKKDFGALVRKLGMERLTESNGKYVPQFPSTKETMIMNVFVHNIGMCLLRFHTHARQHTRDSQWILCSRWRTLISVGQSTGVNLPTFW